MRKLCSLLAVGFFLTGVVRSQDSLEELLRPSGNTIQLTNEKADEAWKQVVGAFQRNDMEIAVEKGKAFLTGDFKPSAYQLLGVNVMMGLAGASETGLLFEDPQDSAEKQRLEEERAAITKRYQDLNAVYLDADARINQLTLNRTRPVQEGTPNHLECVQCAKRMEEALAELEALKPKIEENKKKTAELSGKSNSGLKSQTLNLLDMLIEAGEIEAAAAISNTYIRKVGNDLDVAKKQQDVVRLQEVAEKAKKAIAILREELSGLVDKKMYWGAREKSRQFVGKVEQMSTDTELVRMVKADLSLDPLGIEKNILAGDESFRLIQAQSEADFTRAFEEFEKFTVNFPDHPKQQELSFFIAERKMNSVDRILAGFERDFEDLERRFDPAKLRLFYDGSAKVSSEKSTVLSKSRENGGAEVQGLLELGVAPADSRLVQSQLEGLAASVDLVEKMGLPADREVKFLGIKTKATALLRLIQ
jgi:hypothetical protein